MARILLVDDDIDIRKLVKRILDSVGHSVVVVDNGLTALDELNENIYDLLISDANMPRYSGFDLIKALRKQSRHQKLSIAMLTGRREVQDIQHAIGLGVNEYIIKPINPKVLIEKVQSLLAAKNKSNKTASTEPPVLKATLQSSFSIQNLSTKGFSGISKTPFSVGSEMQLQCTELSDAGLNIRKIKVSHCEPTEPQAESYKIQGEFIELDSEALDELEEFIQYRKAS